MGALRQNIGSAIRTLFKNKGFTITAVLTLALGIGATTAIFSVVYAVFEPMPYPKPDQLVMVWAKTPGGRNSVPAADFLEWRRRSTSFQDLNTWTGASFNVATEDRRGRSNPKRERQHRRDREAPVLEQRANREADVLFDRAHNPCI